MIISTVHSVEYQDFPLMRAFADTYRLSTVLHRVPPTSTYPGHLSIKYVGASATRYHFVYLAWSLAIWRKQLIFGNFHLEHRL
jgi:hypothetical protein